MAENLNYAYIQQTDGGTAADSSSYCLDDDCSTYGRFYLWSAAMDSVAKFSETGKGCGHCPIGGEHPCQKVYRCPVTSTDTVQGVCPEGWHLPSSAEYDTLIATVGGEAVAGLILKSTAGWEDHDGASGNGIDSYGFSALPSGYYGEDRNMLQGKYGLLWTSTEFDNSKGEFLMTDYNSETGRTHYIIGMKHYARPVRCVKN
jgi:uncharacterized protein (TIGR02145 family)